MNEVFLYWHLLPCVYVEVLVHSNSVRANSVLLHLGRHSLPLPLLTDWC